LVHDLGRVAVPTGVWEQRRALRADEWELVRLHPYHSGRILARSPVLEPLSAIVSRHHERVDGTGYPAGVRAGEPSEMANLLAAADVWHALGEARPHRPAFTAVQAARVIAEMPLDRDALRAVLAAADVPAASFPALPVDLTERELQVLRLLSAGHTKRQIAHQVVHLDVDSAHAYRPHLREVRGIDASRSGDVCDAARPRRHALSVSPPSARHIDRTIDVRKMRPSLAFQHQHRALKGVDHDHDEHVHRRRPGHCSRRL
jgi:HD domain